MGVPYSLFGKSSSRKRTIEDSDDEDLEVATTSVRKKLKTADYIYQQLFVNGANSDICVSALGKEWRLHKIYLSQSPYFASMFNGPWKEAKQKRVLISIPNRIITTRSLDQVFGSLYRDEIDINPNEVTSLVSAATLLQLDCVVTQCVDVMCANINLKNAIRFYQSSVENGLLQVRDDCFKWLCRNLMRFTNNAPFLKCISVELMAQLIRSEDLIAVQGEVDIYMMLKKWIYVQVKMSSIACKRVVSTMKTDSDGWFSLYKDQPISFLESNVGRSFSKVFAGLRLQNILSLERSIQVVMDDNIIPKSVVEKIMALKWRMQLCVESSFDATDDIEAAEQALNEEDFHKQAIRCGRILSNDVPHCWRWSGYYYGIDVLLSYKHRIISIKRNCSSHPCPYSVNFKVDRLIHYKLSATSFDRQRKIVWNETTQIERVTMKADDSFIVLRIPSLVQFPITVAFWYAVTPLDAKSRSIVEICGSVWDQSANDGYLGHAHQADAEFRSENVAQNWPLGRPLDVQHFSTEETDDTSASDVV